jgi:uncharacterized membrane protein YhaH (DUF805 family)
MDWYIGVFKKYIDFSGRARRKEFWMFTLVSIIISVALSIVDMAMGSEIAGLSSIYLLVAFIPSLAVLVRRLHDTGRSGLWVLLALTGIGYIVLIIFAALEGEKGDNKYGTDPKAVAA